MNMCSVYLLYLLFFSDSLFDDYDFCNRNVTLSQNKLLHVNSENLVLFILTPIIVNCSPNISEQITFDSSNISWNTSPLLLDFNRMGPFWNIS